MRNIIKQVLKEEVDNRSERIKSIVNKYGIDKAIEVLGGTEIIKNVYQNNPLEFLKEFNDLTPVETDDKIFYINKDKLPLFYYYPNDKYRFVFINYYRIWLFFEMVFGLERSEIQTIIKKWLKETYNLKVLTPEINLAFGTEEIY